MARVFLSYSRQDLAIATKLAGELERRGHELWWDRQLQGGARFASEIEAALDRADAVVVLWSRHSLKSAWVQDEASEGRDSGRLVPVTIDGCKPPLGFRQFHALEFDGKSARPGVEAIDAAIRALAGGEAKTGSAGPAPHARPLPLRAIAAVALLVALAFAAILASRPGGGGSSRLTIAGFEALSPDVPAEAAAALGDEILAALGTDSRIIASRGDKDGAKEGFVASGSLRRSGDRLRFAVHLSEAGSGRQYWSETFERPLASADVAPRQVAVAASLVIRCGLTGRAQHGGKLAEEALAAYLNYCAEYWAETGGRQMSATRGLDFARQAVAIEPDFARGWSAVGRMASWAMREASAGQAQGFRREAADAARKAIALDPSNSQAYEVLAALEPRNSVVRERLHAKSVAVRPGDCGCEHVGYGGFLAGVGRLGEALQQFERARDMVPTSVSVNASMAEGLFALGRNEEANKLIGPILELWPTSRQIHEAIVRTAFWTGTTEPALQSLANPATHFTAAEREAYTAALKAVATGGHARADAARRLARLAGEPGARRALLITALAALGADREALALAADLFGTGGSPDQYVLFEPALSETRRTPEFAALAQRIGLVRYWKESGRKPEFCAADGAPTICAAIGQRLRS